MLALGSTLVAGCWGKLSSFVVAQAQTVCVLASGWGACVSVPGEALLCRTAVVHSHSLSQKRAAQRMHGKL
jgi:hypothetical protein